MSQAPQWVLHPWGIQVCEGLLDYYQACDSYDRDIQEAQKWMVDLQRTLLVLSDLLQCSNE